MGMAIALNRDDGVGVDLDKIWHVLHYALTGTPEEVEHPLGFLMVEGESEEEQEMGGTRFDAAACAKIAEAFEALDHDDVEARLKDPKAADLDLYCWPVGSNEIIPAIYELADLFKGAAETDQAILSMMY